MCSCSGFPHSHLYAPERAGHSGWVWHFASHLTTVIQTTMTAFESREKTEQDNFFSLTSIWQSVKMLGWEETNDIVLTALNAITGKDTRDTWHCTCLVPNVCASVKALTACICGIHSAGCFLFIKLVWNAIDFTVKAFSPCNKHTRYRIQCCAKKSIILKQVWSFLRVLLPSFWQSYW